VLDLQSDKRVVAAVSSRMPECKMSRVSLARLQHCSERLALNVLSNQPSLDNLEGG
jgi:hypothetical protein